MWLANAGTGWDEGPSLYAISVYLDIRKLATTAANQAWAGPDKQIAAHGAWAVQHFDLVVQAHKTTNGYT